MSGKRVSRAAVGWPRVLGDRLRVGWGAASPTLRLCGRVGRAIPAGIPPLASPSSCPLTALTCRFCERHSQYVPSHLQLFVFYCCLNWSPCIFCSHRLCVGLDYLPRVVSRPSGLSLSWTCCGGGPRCRPGVSPMTLATLLGTRRFHLGSLRPRDSLLPSSLDPFG